MCEHFPSQSRFTDETMTAMGNEDIGLSNGNGDVEDLDDIDFDSNRNKEKKENQKRHYEVKSKLVEVPHDKCNCKTTAFKHYVHESCLPLLNEVCPRCQDLDARLLYGSESELPIYCQEVSARPGLSGLQTTSKIEKIIEWVKNIPSNEKAILYSFFKSNLDIFEGVLVDHLKIECARFDGDLDPEDRSIELQRFKESSSCKILLATVQSSGTGLNIVEANHIGFIDRWFNPCVHAQAEDRVRFSSLLFSVFFHRILFMYFPIFSVIVLSRKKMFMLSILMCP